jgi:hypothetical protein
MDTGALYSKDRHGFGYLLLRLHLVREEEVGHGELIRIAEKIWA